MRLGPLGWLRHLPQKSHSALTQVTGYEKTICPIMTYLRVHTLRTYHVTPYDRYGPFPYTYGTTLQISIFLGTRAQDTLQEDARERDDK